MGCQAGALRVLGEVTNHWREATFPIGQDPTGCYNPNSKLDGSDKPSTHAKGEAIDVGIRPSARGRTGTGQEIFLFLHANRARLGILQLIWDGQIWSATNRPDLIRPYTSNPHRDHIHCQFTPDAARDPRLTVLPFDAAPAARSRPRRSMEFIQANDGDLRVYVTDHLTKRWVSGDEKRAVTEPYFDAMGFSKTVRKVSRDVADRIPTVGPQPDRDGRW